MSSSCSSTVGVVRPNFPIWYTVCARTLPPLALLAVLLPTSPADGHKLKLETTFPGQHDSLIGDPPVGGNPPLCAPDADPTIAVGGNDAELGSPVHAAADWNYGIFHPDGVTPFQEALSSFFNNLLPNQQSVLEVAPKLLFDQAADRFVLVTAASTLNNAPVPEQSWITIGATATQDIVTNPSDCTYRIDANILPNAPSTNFYPDEPRLGMTSDSIVISANMYAFNTNVFQYSKLWIIPKSASFEKRVGAPQNLARSCSLTEW